jgi:outer membrane protein assembly factor BamB
MISSETKLSRWLAIGLGCIALAFASEAQAQRSADLLPEEKLRAVGLTSAWHTQLEFDSTRGRLSGIALFYDDYSSQFVVDITHPGGRLQISEFDLTPLGKPLGVKGAKQKAAQWISDWKKRNPKATAEPQLEELVIPDSFVVTAAQRGMVQGLNAETGNTRWVSKIGSEMLPTLTPSINHDRVAVINGSRLFMMNKKDGKVIWDRLTHDPPGGGPALSNQFAFVPMMNGMMETFDITKDKRPSTTELFRSHGRIFLQPVVFRDAVAWVTDHGNTYVANSEAKGIRYRVTSRELNNKRTNPVRSSPLFTPGPPTFLLPGNDRPAQFYVGTEDGYILCVDADKGSIIARFSAGEPVSQSPVVVQSRVYAVTDSNTLFCMDSMSMLELWAVSGIRQFLAGSANRIYVKDAYENLVVLDAKTGSRIGSIPMAGIDFVFSNHQSDRIYVGTSTGVLQCIRENKAYYPWVHSGMEMKKKFEQVLNNQAQAEAEEGDAPEPEMKAKPAAGDDPFGAAEPEMKKEAAPADDPFK